MNERVEPEASKENYNQLTSVETGFLFINLSSHEI